MNENAYKTVCRAATASFVEKKSEFIGYVTPCEREEEALAFIRRIRSEHADAKHCVYAFLLRENHLSRFTDDGEPAGTAGVPVLDVLKKGELVDCAVAVVRYFGGILLGTGGLVRAYTRGAQAAITAAGVAKRCPFDEITLRVGYPVYQRLPSLLAMYGVITDNAVFTDSVLLELAVPTEHTEPFLQKIVECSGGTAVMMKKGIRYDVCGTEEINLSAPV